MNFVGDLGQSQVASNATALAHLNDPNITDGLRSAMLAQLEMGKPPAINTYEHWLVDRFWELNTGRSYGQHGPMALSFMDLAAYCDVFGDDLEPIEAQCLKAIDQAYLAAVFEEQNKARQ